MEQSGNSCPTSMVPSQHSGELSAESEHSHSLIPYVPGGTGQISKATFSKPLGGELNIYHEKMITISNQIQTVLVLFLKSPELEDKTEEHK